jgi:phosphonate transport system permease protein
VRASSVVGFTRAGGIGLQLADRIRVNNWDEVGFLLIMILLTVSCIDQLSKTIRRRFI